MKSRFLVLCRSAVLEPNSTVFAGLPVDVYRVPRLPARCTVAVLLGLEADVEDSESCVELDLEVRSPDCELLYQRGIALTPGKLGEHGESWASYHLAPVAFTARSAGPHEVRCCHGRKLLVRATLMVTRGR